MSSFRKLKGMAGASMVAGAGLVGMMASSARAGVKTSWTSTDGGYLTFHDANKDWAHGFYFMAVILQSLPMSIPASRKGLSARRRPVPLR